MPGHRVGIARRSRLRHPVDQKLLLLGVRHRLDRLAIRAVDDVGLVLGELGHAIGRAVVLDERRLRQRIGRHTGVKRLGHAVVDLLLELRLALGLGLVLQGVGLIDARHRGGLGLRRQMAVLHLLDQVDLAARHRVARRDVVRLRRPPAGVDAVVVTGQPAHCLGDRRRVAGARRHDHALRDALVAVVVGDRRERCLGLRRQLLESLTADLLAHRILRQGRAALEIAFGILARDRGLGGDRHHRAVRLGHRVGAIADAEGTAIVLVGLLAEPLEMPQHRLGVIARRRRRAAHQRVGNLLPLDLLRPRPEMVGQHRIVRPELGLVILDHARRAHRGIR